MPPWNSPDSAAEAWPALAVSVMTGQNAARAAGDSSLSLLPYASATYGFLGFRIRDGATKGAHPIFGDAATRRALALAVDRETLAYLRFTGREEASVQLVEASGNRCVVVVDRGWIFAGDLTEENGRIRLTRAVWVFRWESIGFAAVVANPKTTGVDIRPIKQITGTSGNASSRAASFSFRIWRARKTRVRTVASGISSSAAASRPPAATSTRCCWRSRWPASRSRGRWPRRRSPRHG